MTIHDEFNEDYDRRIRALERQVGEQLVQLRTKQDQISAAMATINFIAKQIEKFKLNKRYL